MMVDFASFLANLERKNKDEEKKQFKSSTELSYKTSNFTFLGCFPSRSSANSCQNSC